MTEPIRFQPGEPLSAASLNNALDYSRPQHAEVPNEGNAFFGSKSANGRSSVERERMILVRAVEDFAVQTTTCESDDDVPSGRVEYVRLIPQLNVHLPPEDQEPFYVYDPVAGLMEVDSKVEGDVFHCVWNDDSGRWEVLSASADVAPAAILHAIVCRCVGNGWYVMELADGLNQQPDDPDCDPQCEASSDSDSESLSVSDEDECDLCHLVCGDASASDDLTDECGGLGEFDSCRTSPGGNGTYVYAFDKRVVPLKIGGMATIAWLGDMCDGSVSGSDSVSVSASVSDETSSQRLYVVLNGEYGMVTIPHEVWECCPSGGIQKTACYTFIVEGVMCTGPEDPCSEGSESA